MVQTGSYNVSFWEELGVSCKLSPFNCTNAGFEKALYLETAPYAIGYALQMAIFVTVPILIFRPYYQVRSTGSIVIVFIVFSRFALFMGTDAYVNVVLARNVGTSTPPAS